MIMSKEITCRSSVMGEVYIPPEETVITRASGTAFSSRGNISSVIVKVPNTFTAKFNSKLQIQGKRNM